MKIRFDENISPRLVAAVRALEPDHLVEITHIRDQYQTGLPDPDWMFQFRDEGGTAMISGDHNILQTPVNLKAYTESGLISIWPPANWPQYKRFGQAALVIVWWPAIKARIERSVDGEQWRIPPQWTPGVDLFKPLQNPRAHLA